MKPKVYIAFATPPEVEEYIGRYCDYTKWSEERPLPRKELIPQMGEVEGLLTAGHRIDEEFLRHAPRLKIVSNISVGYNNFDLEAMRSHKVLGTNTPGVLDDTVADLVFGLLLSAARRIPELDRLVKEGRWKTPFSLDYSGIDVHHAILGIIGMGRIGEAVARRARLGFSMEVLYYNRNRKPQAESRLGVQYRSLEQLLQEADFVLLMTPLTPETEGLIGYRELCLMKKSAIFINASRGATVKEKELIQALQEGRIGGAALDVFEREPVSADNPLLAMPNVVTLPHIGGNTVKTRRDMAMLAAENLVKGVLGQVPPSVVEELKGLLP